MINRTGTAAFPPSLLNDGLGVTLLWRMEMKHAKIFMELANRADPNVSILDAAMEQISILKAAIERMRVAGGKDEFQEAFDAAKNLL